MTFGNLLLRLKLEAPNIGVTGVDDTTFLNLCNQACDIFNLIAKVYKGYTDFAIQANKSVYNISEVAPNYLGTDKRGVFCLDSSSKWKRVIPKTEAWISTRYQDYLNASSVYLPTFYYIDGDELGFYPPPSTDISNGCRLFHLKKANPMSNANHYPFSGSTTEITALRPADEAIIAFVLWKLKPAYGQVTDIDLSERRFLTECQKSAKQIGRRKDLSNDFGYGLKI